MAGARFESQAILPLLILRDTLSAPSARRSGHAQLVSAVLSSISLPVSPATIVLIVVAVVILIYHQNRVMAAIVKPAEDFLQAMAQQEFTRARSHFSDDLPPEEERSLRQFLAANPFLQFQSVRWHGSEIRNNWGRLQGTVTLKNGVKIPLQVVVAYEDDAWKIQAIEKIEPGANFSIDAGFGADF